MELELDRAASRLKKEQASRVQKEKARRLKERAAQDEAARNTAEMEAKSTEKRLEREAKQVAAEEAEAEREQKVLDETGGIEFTEVFKAASLSATRAAEERGGDRVTLPPSALRALDFKGAMDVRGPITFELSTREGARTHAGVLEFTAEDGTVGLPDKTRVCLGAVTEAEECEEGGYNTRVTARFVRLPKGTYALLRPRSDAFSQAVASAKDGGTRPVFDSVRGKWVLPGLEGVLHAALQPLCCLTLGDALVVRHAGEEHVMEVVALQPADAVSLIDTDLQVDLSPSLQEQVRLEAEQHAAAAAEVHAQQAQAEAAAAAVEVAERAAAAAHRLPLEPPLEGAEGKVVTVAVRLLSGGRVQRRFLANAPLQQIFDFLDGGGHVTSDSYALCSAFPRRVFTSAQAGETLEGAGLVLPQEALLVELL